MEDIITVNSQLLTQGSMAIGSLGVRSYGDSAAVVIFLVCEL